MKAVEITAYGAPEVLRLTQRADPQAGPGELLIRVAASGVNRPDVLQRTGNYAVPPGASDIPGLEVAGEVVGGDAQAMAERGIELGQRVCALVAGGGYAQLCVAPVGQCLPVPRDLSDVQAASLPETFFHGVEQCVRSLATASWPDLVGARRLQRHRRDRHSNGQGHGRQGDCDRGQR